MGQAFILVGYLGLLTAVIGRLYERNQQSVLGTLRAIANRIGPPALIVGGFALYEASDNVRAIMCMAGFFWGLGVFVFWLVDRWTEHRAGST